MADKQVVQADDALDKIKEIWLKFQLQLNLMSSTLVPTAAKVWYIVGWLYVLSPVDLVPDFILALGQLDDIIIFCLCLRTFYDHVPAAVMKMAKIEVGLLKPDA